MLKAILLLVLASLTNAGVSDDRVGTVCLGINLARSGSEHSNRLHLKVGASKNIYFVRSYNGPITVVKNLDLNKEHIVYIYFDDVADKLGMNEKELLELLTFTLYKKMGVHGVMCGRIINTSEMEFHGLLEKYGECINYSTDYLKNDIENLEKL